MFRYVKEKLLVMPAALSECSRERTARLSPLFLKEPGISIGVRPPKLFLKSYRLALPRLTVSYEGLLSGLSNLFSSLEGPASAAGVLVFGCFCGASLVRLVLTFVSLRFFLDSFSFLRSLTHFAIAALTVCSSFFF